MYAHTDMHFFGTICWILDIYCKHQWWSRFPSHLTFCSLSWHWTIYEWKMGFPSSNRHVLSLYFLNLVCLYLWYISISSVNNRTSILQTYILYRYKINQHTCSKRDRMQILLKRKKCRRQIQCKVSSTFLKWKNRQHKIQLYWHLHLALAHVYFGKSFRTRFSQMNDEMKQQFYSFLFR